MKIFGIKIGPDCWRCWDKGYVHSGDDRGHWVWDCGRDDCDASKLRKVTRLISEAARPKC